MDEEHKYKVTIWKKEKFFFSHICVDFGFHHTFSLAETTLWTDATYVWRSQNLHSLNMRFIISELGVVY